MSKFNETIKKMQNITDDIKKKADASISELDPETVEKVQTVASKTIDVINEAAFKLKDAVDEIEDEESLEAFLKRVDEKCEDAKKYAFSKIEELVPPTQDEYVRIDNDKPVMDKILENENVAKAVNLAKNLKNTVVDFYNAPSTQKKINETKLAALNIANKGLELVRKTLEK